MQPQPGNNLIERALQWIRDLWAGSGDRRQVAKSDATDQPDTAAPTTGEAAATPGTQRDDVAANGSSERGVASPTGASEDEYATGGYTGDNPSIETVEEAAEPLHDAPDATDGHTGEPLAKTGPLSDERMDGPVPQSPNYGVGNLGLGSQGSLGTATEPGANDVLSPEADPAVVVSVSASDPVTLSNAAIPDDTESRQPGVVDVSETAGIAPGLGGTAGDEALSTIDEMDVRGIGDLGAEELGSLEELDEDALAFADDASDRFDANSEPGFDADVPDSLAAIDHEDDDYSSSALQDAGLRIVDEDDAGLTFREPAGDEFVDPGSVIDEPPTDTGDARPLSDFTQEQSGFASESDEPVAAAGDRSTKPLGSDTGLDTPDTWTEDASTEELGAAGELAAMDFGSTVGEDTELDVTGLFVTSDIDVADLSYLDDSENARFDFPDRPAETLTSAADLPASAGVVDDIGPSPTGISDAQGPVESDASMADDVLPVATSEPDDIPDSSTGVADDIAESPTGVVDAAATTNAIEDELSSSIPVSANIPNFATDKDSDPAPSSVRSTNLDQAAAARVVGSGPGGSVRGDDSGSCPADFPIKGNSSSKVYHVPGIPSHPGTKAEWCFASEEQAQAAGYRPPGQRNRGGARSSSGPNPGRNERPRGSSSR